MLTAVRVVVTGATGNIGTAVLHWLRDRPGIECLAGIARRVPPQDSAGGRIRWHSVDLADPGAGEVLADVFAGADAVVHAAWRIAAGHDREQQRRTNRDGSAAVVAAAHRAGVGQLLFLSSAAVYSPAPAGARVREDWPRRGIPGSAYSSDKVAVEDMLDRTRVDAPDLRIVRVRPPSVLQETAAEELTAMALGRLAPLARRTAGRLPLLPLPSGTRAQLVAAGDVAELVGRVLLARSSGAYNVAADPILTGAEIAKLLGGRQVPVPPLLARAVVDLTFRLRLQRLDPSWLDLLLRVPPLDCTKAREELGWRDRHDARTLLARVRDAVASGTGPPHPPL